MNLNTTTEHPLISNPYPIQFLIPRDKKVGIYILPYSLVEPQAKPKFKSLFQYPVPRNMK